MSIINFISLRYIFPFANSKKPSVSAIAGFTGLFLSVCTLIIVCSVFNGFKSEFIKTIVGINSYISVNSYGAKISNYAAVKTQLEGEGYKTYATINGQAMIISQNYSSGIVVKGLEKKAFSQKQMLKNSIVDGSLHGIYNAKWQIVLGSDLAKNLEVKVGDTVKLISPNTNNTIFGSIPIHKEFVVGAIFNLKMSHYDANFAFLSLENAQRFFDYEPNQVSTIEVDVKNNGKIKAAARKISEFFAGQFESQHLYASTYEQDNASYIAAIKTQSAVINLILSLFVIVAVFIVFWVLKIMIAEKTKEVAILQTLGYSKREISKIFFTSGLVICLSGLFCGNIFGIIFALNVDNIRLFLEALFGVQIFDAAFYFMSYLPSNVYLMDILLINGFCIGCIIFAIKKALGSLSKINPSQLIK